MSRYSQQFLAGFFLGIGPDCNGVVVAAADDKVAQSGYACDPIFMVNIFLRFWRTLLFDIKNIDDHFSRYVVTTLKKNVEGRPKQVVCNDAVKRRNVVITKETFDEVVQRVCVYRNRNGKR